MFVCLCVRETNEAAHTHKFDVARQVEIIFSKLYPLPPRARLPTIVTVIIVVIVVIIVAQSAKTLASRTIGAAHTMAEVANSPAII